MAVNKEEHSILYPLITVLAVSMTVYHILYTAHIFEYLGIYIMVQTHRAFHVAFVLGLIYLLFPTIKGTLRHRLPWYHIPLAIIAVITPLYIAFSYQSRSPFWATRSITNIEVILGILLIVVSLEAARRILDWAMPIITIIFILYAAYGKFLPGLLQHSGFSIKAIVNSVVYSGEGIFGLVTGVSATIIITFILFSQFLLISGAGEFFLKLSYALVGKYRGGPAKIAVIGSAFFGTISGSAAANVASTGTFTIPLMKRIGYRPEFAGAVEAVASNGGQLMPPVMGTVVFIMAEWLQVSYWSICLASAIPAVLYYLALYLYVDIEAMKLKLGNMKPSEIPRVKETLKTGWIFVIPVAVLLYLMMVLQYAPQTAALYSVVALVIVSMFRKEARIGPRKLMMGLRGTARSVLVVAVACISSGIIISTAMLTGLGPNVTHVLVAASGGNTFIIVVLAAIACFIFGLGVSTIAIYMIVATMIAPALAEAGIPLLATHLFVFWWGLTSAITPPVAPTVFVACGISGGGIWKTGWTATRLGMMTFLLPFVWIYKPGLLLMGSPIEVIVDTAVTLAALVMLSYGLAGFMLKWWQRILLLGSALLVLMPNWVAIIFALAIGISIYILHRIAVQRTRLLQVAATNRAL